jgi:phenylalanyl-tRNA synthetase beta chain
MELVSNNLHVECPQKIFEMGKITVIDEKKETRTRDEERLAGVVYHATASFSEVKSALDSFFTNLALEWRIRETKHPSFIDGRAGTAWVDNKEVGILGEIHPKVLEAWSLENPVAAFELNMDKIVELKRASRQKANSPE